MMDEPRVPKRGELWRHYKGGVYEVVGLARHSETQEDTVVYQLTTGDPGMWCRPLKMWLETVDTGHVMVPRFAFTGMTVDRPVVLWAEPTLSLAERCYPNPFKSGV